MWVGRNWTQDLWKSKEQSVLITAEPSLQPLKSFFLKKLISLSTMVPPYKLVFTWKAEQGDSKEEVCLSVEYDPAAKKKRKTIHGEPEG